MPVGGQPTQEQIVQAKKHRIQVVLNLRASGESTSPNVEKKWLESQEVQYVHLSIQGAKGLTAQNVEAFDRILKRQGKKQD